MRTAVIVILLAAPALSSATNSGEDRLFREAAELERKQDWRGAAEIYWKALGQDRQSVEIREKYLNCLRRIRLSERHNDATYRRRIQELTFARSLTAYLDALAKIQTNYVERVSLTALFQQGLQEFAFALSEPAFRQGLAPAADDVAVNAFLVRMREAWTSAEFREPDEVRVAVKRIALEAQTALSIKPSFVVMEFVCGACNALDERTAFLPPSEEYDAVLSQLNSLGLLLASNTDQVMTVERVTIGSWAALAGLRPGDRIIRTLRRDGRDEIGPLVEIEIASRGEQGTRVVKLPESLPSVLEEDVLPGGIAYLRIASFQKNTMYELEQALVRLQMRGMRALVLDLRGNPGGLFPVSVQVAERFLPDGIIVTTQGQGPAFNRTFQSHSGMGAIDVPLVVLIDGETASAAEVLAGALKDNQRALLIGQATFGKGTIQTVLQLTDGGGLRITLARFFTPRGLPYNGIGVAPHLIDSMRPREAAIEQARALLSMRP